MYSLKYTNRSKKDMKRCQKRGYNMSELKNSINPDSRDQFNFRVDEI